MPWCILNPASKTIHEVPMPSEVDLKIVQNGMTYDQTTTENDVPALVRDQVRLVD